MNVSVSVSVHVYACVFLCVYVYACVYVWHRLKYYLFWETEQKDHVSQGSVKLRITQRVAEAEGDRDGWGWM